MHIQHADVEDFDGVVSHWPRFLLTCYQRQTVYIFLTIKYFAKLRDLVKAALAPQRAVKKIRSGAMLIEVVREEAS